MHGGMGTFVAEDGHFILGFVVVVVVVLVVLVVVVELETNVMFSAQA